MKQGPRIIAFEGVDGAGKSTVIRRVADYLRERGQTVYLPRSGKEHDSRPTRMIRRVTRDPRNIMLSPRAELLLYCAREAQVLKESVRPALERGDTVLLDRCLLTPLVLGCFGRGLPREDCERAADLAADGLSPDLTLVFDVHPRTSRLRKRIEKVRTHRFRDRGRKGLSGSALKERVRDGYGVIAKERGYPLFHVERITPDQLAQRVIAVLQGGEVVESPDELVPPWMTAPDATLSDALDALPMAAGVYLSRRLRASRELRIRAHVEEPSLVAWALDREDPLREEMAQHDPEYALGGLAGRPILDDDLRVRLAEEHPEAVLRSLKGVTSAQADELRERLADRAPGAAVESLQGREDAPAEQLRNSHWDQANAYERAASITDCPGDTAWERREELLRKHAFVGVESLKRLDPERVEPWFEQFAEQAPRAALGALIGRGDERAHAWRRRLEHAGREMVDSLRGLDDPAAWDLREKFCERWPSTVAHSLLGLPKSPRKEALASRCAEFGRGDVHVLRRLTQLDEYSMWPDWAKTQRDTE
jgi:dTMP kinase